MVICQIKGGLGNQMFQYAYARSLQAKGYAVKLDISQFKEKEMHGGYGLDKFNIDIEIASSDEIENLIKKNFCFKIKKKLSLPNKKYIREKKLAFNKLYLEPNDHCYVEGYFQSEKFFYNIRNTIINNFEFTSALSIFARSISKKILNSNDSISVHVRRGDYVKNKTTNSFHGTCSTIYYKQAIRYFLKKLKTPHFYVFSDDIEWAKKNIAIINTTYIDSIENREPHEDLYLMSLCSHNLIANSTFSWWGAWLNQNISKIVIAPKQWFADKKKQDQAIDIVPENWVRI